ncbi:MAG: hypothetical protein ACLGI3_14905 [Actinomycetes bacterium]
MLISCRTSAPAADSQILSEVQQVLERRGALTRAPATLAVSDAVALGIASVLRSPTAAGQVLANFARTGSADSDALIEAAESERGYASAEGSAALYCLIVWARSKVFQGLR